MGQLLRFPVIPAAIDRIVERDRAENITAERLQAVKTARAVLRSPEVFTDDILRDACAALQTWGDGIDHCQADAMIFTLNKRERERAHEAARIAVETPASVARRHWPQAAALCLGLSLAIPAAAIFARFLP